MNNPLNIAQQVLNLALQNKDRNSMVNTPWRDSAIQAIQSGNAQVGQQLADNIVKSYGFSSQQEALQAFFQGRMMGSK